MQQLERIAYTAEALSTGGGRNGHVRTRDGRLDLDMAAPVEMGGSGEGANPEQLFAAGYAACFHSALRGAAKRRKIDIGDTTVGVRVSIGRTEGGGFGLAVAIEVAMPGVPHDQARELAEEADRDCPYSNATRGNIAIELSVVDD